MPSLAELLGLSQRGNLGASPTRALAAQPGGREASRFLTEEETRHLQRDADAEQFMGLLRTIPTARQMARVAQAGEAKRGWYMQSAKALVDVFGPDAPRFAGLLSALSPQTSVEANFSNTMRVWEAWDKAGRPTDPNAARSIIENSVARGANASPETISAMEAWTKNGTRALTALDPSPSALGLSGPKVDSFFRNLVGITHEVTNDTWMARFAGVDQELIGGRAVKNTADDLSQAFGLKNQAYVALSVRAREAAKRLQDATGEPWTADQVQETVWSWAKSLSEASGQARMRPDEFIRTNGMPDSIIGNTVDFGGLFASPEYSPQLARMGLAAPNIIEQRDLDPGANATADIMGSSNQVARGDLLTAAGRLEPRASRFRGTRDAIARGVTDYRAARGINPMMAAGVAGGMFFATEDDAEAGGLFNPNINPMENLTRLPASQPRYSSLAPSGDAEDSFTSRLGRVASRVGTGLWDAGVGILESPSVLAEAVPRIGAGLGGMVVGGLAGITQLLPAPDPRAVAGAMGVALPAGIPTGPRLAGREHAAAAVRGAEMGAGRLVSSVIGEPTPAFRQVMGSLSTGLDPNAATRDLFGGTYGDVVTSMQERIGPVPGALLGAAGVTALAGLGPAELARAGRASMGVGRLGGGDGASLTEAPTQSQGVLSPDPFGAANGTATSTQPPGLLNPEGIRAGGTQLEQASGPYSGVAGSDLEGFAGTPASRVDVPGRGLVEFHSFRPAQEAAAQYMRETGMPYVPPTQYTKTDKARAQRIATEYGRMEHRPNDPEVRAAYEQMANETLAQWRAIERTGLQVEFIDGPDPYKSPRDAMLDVVENNHMYVFSTRDGFGTDDNFDASSSPLLADAGVQFGGKPALVNDVFRAVHDYFGHIKNGVGFRSDGEENAWQAHASMYSPLARRAMTSETRGQNSWLNWGPYGERNRGAATDDTVFADQKTGLLPEWVSEEGRLGGPDRAPDPDFSGAFEDAPPRKLQPQRRQRPGR